MLFYFSHAVASVAAEPGNVQQGLLRADRRRRGASVLAALIAVLLIISMVSEPAYAEAPPAPQNNASPQRPLFGAFTYGGVWQGMEPVYDLEQSLGRRLDIVHWFMNWDHTYDGRLVEEAATGGRIPLISWQPHRQTVGDIAAGRYDDYIRSWAHGLRSAHTTVYLRPFPEMNGDWVPWNGQPDLFRKAWIRTVDLFRSEGADNVRWVWSPNITDGPTTPENAMERYYPGDAYVDVLALDGYNWGTVRDWSSWRSYEDIFAQPYERVAAIGPQPVWLAEFASTSEGGDKAEWIREMLASTAFPRITALVWFNENKEGDWRIDNVPATVQAAREGLAGGNQTATR